MTSTSRAEAANGRAAAAPDTGRTPMVSPTQPITVTGGGRLAGSVTVGSSVGAAHVLLAAAALQPSVKLADLPQSPHVEQMIGLLRQMGREIQRDSPSQVTVKASTRTDRELAVPLAPRALFNDQRGIPAAVHLISAFLRDDGYAVLPWPASDLEDVLTVFKEFGDEIQTRDSGRYTVVVAAEPNTASMEITMRTRAAAPTVAAVLRAASVHSRITVRRPSRHPEVHALFTALRQLGWWGQYSEDKLDLEPGTRHWPTSSWTVPGDDLEAAACLCALAATRGSGTIKGATLRTLTILRMLLTQAGARVELAGEQAKIYHAWKAPGSRWIGLAASAGTEPRELPSDQLAMLLPLASGLRGEHRLTDRLAADRLARIVQQFKAFGAPIEIGRQPGLVEIAGPLALKAPAEGIEAEDPASLTALVITALVANGTTTIHALDHIHHAHPTLLASLQRLGASIEGGAR